MSFISLLYLFHHCVVFLPSDPKLFDFVDGIDFFECHQHNIMPAKYPSILHNERINCIYVAYVVIQLA